MTIERANEVVIDRCGPGFEALLCRSQLSAGPHSNGYVPTVKDATVAEALKALGYLCWNPRTQKNW